MDQVQHPLDWWALGGYQEVMRNTGWSIAKARREVKKTMRVYGWHPIGRRGYDGLRNQIMNGEMLNDDLV